MHAKAHRKIMRIDPANCAIYAVQDLNIFWNHIKPCDALPPITSHSRGSGIVQPVNGP
ncbi:hypothetical protein GWA01_03890 [Gluconobacter wancherniae NBRC 103581]|uniref:Uncharacterized protein n=1 Tax=Gluconobacter wancherniae NBRC 103581 TaxID=656744 RepID=A0A511AWN0_9PROT|nr:hypothetical protein AA103581_1066 [Gluconobacter wancherniae NBRC 103581]GEK92619.1 hypothetical protein GWA01_03890 [Gluconobacter wancherniae NBRC 103581]